MKLAIQIPCWNEEKTLPVALGALPASVPGFDEVEVFVVDDGSTDGTQAVAREHGATVVSAGHHRGLAKTFMLGIGACLEHGADVIVNTDADNQYCADDIVRLVEPILAGTADIVVGARPIKAIEHFSATKKLLQRVGSFVVAKLSGASVEDAPSGFRAISRHAALGMNVFDPYTYTLETLIQAGQHGLRVVSVPVRVNDDLRPSRLVKSVGSYVLRSVQTIFRILIIYKPYRFFQRVGVVVLLVGIGIGGRFLYYYFSGEGSGHVQSLILASLLMTMGFQTILLAVIADLLSVNRRLIEDVQRIQRERYWGGPSGKASGFRQLPEAAGDETGSDRDESSADA